MNLFNITNRFELNIDFVIVSPILVYCSISDGISIRQMIRCFDKKKKGLHLTVENIIPILYMCIMCVITLFAFYFTSHI